jgi:hypothetical protein
MTEEFEQVDVIQFTKPKKPKKVEASKIIIELGKEVAPKVEAPAKVIDHDKRYIQLLKRATELLNKNNPELGIPLFYIA